MVPGRFSNGVQNMSVGYRVNKGLSLRQAAGRWFLLDTRGGKIHHLNDTALQIWKWLEKGLSFDEIVRSLVDEYDVSEGQASSDLAEIIDVFKT